MFSGSLPTSFFFLEYFLGFKEICYLSVASYSLWTDDLQGNLYFLNVIHLPLPQVSHWGIIFSSGYLVGQMSYYSYTQATLRLFLFPYMCQVLWVTFFNKEVSVMKFCVAHIIRTCGWYGHSSQIQFREKKITYSPPGLLRKAANNTCTNRI